ncbi:MAG: hypothetical protein AAF298_26230 [Cyanobacteria bacterium P01_A01_bin.40]
MLRHNLVALAAAWAIFPTGANAAQLNLNLDRHPPELRPGVQRGLAHYDPPPRPHRYKKRHKLPKRGGITIVL